MRIRRGVSGCTALAATLVLVFAVGACTGERAGGQASRADTAGGSPARGAPAARGDTAEGPAVTTLRIGDVEAKVEVADEPSERERGLMYRDSLPEDTGMLFVYPRERILSFWMRNTKIALDIAYVNQRGYIVDIQRMEPQSDELHESAAPAMYAVEMTAGWFEEHDIEVGDRVRF